MSRVPRIRFKGFEEDWEQRKLGEIFKEYSEKNHVELPPLTIIQGGGTIRRDESDRALQYDKGSLSNYKMVNKDDFIVHLRSFEGGLEKANSIGIISPAYHTFSGENTDTTFYYTYFRSKKFVEIDLKPHVYGIRDGRSIDIEGMKTIKIPYTIFKEQMCIGKAIDVIDHLITLHQRKLKKLKNIKKSMLENLFPKNGEKTPRIRFSGFTEDWEQRKLGEVVEIYDGVHQTPNYTDNGIMFLSVENITKLKSSKFISEEAFKRDYKFYPQENDILMTRIGDVGTTNVVTDNSLKAYYVSLALLKYKSTNPFFLSSAIQSDFVQSGLANRTLKTAIPIKINKDEIGKVNVMLPLLKDEQELIGYCFHNLDHLITLHQSKLEKLRKIKKSMLESMFV